MRGKRAKAIRKIAAKTNETLGYPTGTQYNEYRNPEFSYDKKTGIATKIREGVPLMLDNCLRRTYQKMKNQYNAG